MARNSGSTARRRNQRGAVEVTQRRRTFDRRARGTHRRLDGDRRAPARGIAFDPSPSEDYPDVTGTPWEELVRRLDRAHQSVLTRVDLLTEADLDRNVAGKSYSVAFMLNGLAQHTTYHAGQIALLKKII